eukprot:7241993-Prymnesium_polylepis.2
MPPRMEHWMVEWNNPSWDYIRGYSSPTCSESRSSKRSPRMIITHPAPPRARAATQSGRPVGAARETATQRHCSARGGRCERQRQCAHTRHCSHVPLTVRFP